MVASLRARVASALAFTFILAGALSYFCPISAQVIAGQIVDARTEDPVAQAYVGIVTEDRRSVVAATADREGFFTLKAPLAGSYYLHVSAIGYRPIADGIFELGEGGSMEVEIRLEPDPLMMDSIRATVDRSDRYLRQVGFYERREKGWGHHLEHEEIRERAVFTVTDALRDLNRVYVYGELPYPRVAIRKGVHTCPPHIFLDGFLVHRGGVEGRMPPPHGPATPDQFVHPADVAAIEVYRSGTEAPIEYNLPNTCGVLLIWTWHG